MYSERFQFSL